MMRPSAIVEPAPDPAALAERWRRLESRTAPNFFLSWTWIGRWLETCEAEPWLVSVRYDGREVALGLFVACVETRHKLLRVRQLRLHETGDPAKDVITIEYNSLLCVPGMEAVAWRTALGALRAAAEPRWDELVVSGADDETQALLSGLGAPTAQRAATTSAYVDLEELRAEGAADFDGYVATLGRSTRAQIRRAVRFYGERGALTLEAARDAGEAAAFMAELEAHHQQRWTERGAPGAFGWPYYRAFHTGLIETALPAGEVEVLRASAGGRPFGWLYNLLTERCALYYLGGFDYEEDPRAKPGLVAHALATERHLQAGRAAYDFMGGDNRYKRNLGRPGPAIVSLAIQRPRLGLMLERAARWLKSGISNGN